MKALVLTLSFSLLFITALMAQLTGSPFQEIDESVVMDTQKISQRVISPNSYKTLMLNKKQLDLILKSAPKEEAIGTKQSLPFEIQLPNGRKTAFHLIEYSMMEPGLSAQYPTFKTYHGYGVKDPSQRIRLDWTLNGLNAMMMLPEGLAF